MKKSYYLIIITIGLLLFSCGSQKKQAETPEQIKEQIFAYKEQVADINKKIKDLEILLKESDTTKENSALKVNIKQLIVEPFAHYFEATGSVEAVQEAFISPQINGQIKRIYVKEGDFVKKGQLLASLNSEVMRNNLEELKIQMILADTLYQKQKQLWKQNIGSEVQYLQAKTQKESLERSIKTLKSQIAMSNIRAPFSGIVDQIFQKEGELGTPGMRIIQLVNLNYMFVTADLSEKYLKDISQRDSMIITFPSYPDITINTTVFQKGNIIDPNNRTFIIKARFKNIKNQIKPNLLAIMRLKDYETPDALLVPSMIINQDINGFFLYLVALENGKNIAKKTYVEIGKADNYNTIITKGLKEGDKVIVDGYNLVRDGNEIIY